VPRRETLVACQQVECGEKTIWCALAYPILWRRLAPISTARMPRKGQCDRDDIVALTRLSCACGGPIQLMQHSSAASKVQTAYSRNCWSVSHLLASLGCLKTIHKPPTREQTRRESKV
jgi:hypothetical protein